MCALQHYCCSPCTQTISLILHLLLATTTQACALTEALTSGVDAGGPAEGDPRGVRHLHLGGATRQRAESAEENSITEFTYRYTISQQLYVKQCCPRVRRNYMHEMIAWTHAD